MSGLLATFGTDTDRHTAPFGAALSRLARLGGDHEQLWREEDSALFVTRKAWQLTPDFSGAVLVLEDRELVVAADASLYGTHDLRAALRARGLASGDSPSHLIAAAYRAWGDDLVEHVNGDYAFVIWDRARRRVLAAREQAGQRPMYWARWGSGLALSSSSRSLAELTGRSTQLRMDYLGGLCAGLVWSAGTATAFEGVEVLPPGNRLVWEGGKLRVEPFWAPREAPDERPIPREEAAEELLRLLEVATVERLGSGTNTVWMSGGWDSTAIFAAGQNRLRREGRSERLVPVSIAYPQGDPGYEDPLVQMVADRWEAEVNWIQSEEIPLFDDLVGRAESSDEPPAHMYELWNRALAKGTRACGSRIAFDGNGGDQLFGGSDVVLADHLRRGELRAFVRHIRAKRRHGIPRLLSFAAMPFIPPWMYRAAEKVTGKFYRWHYMERRAAPWIRPDFLRHYRLRERDLATLRTGGSSFAHDETLSLLTMPVIGWNCGYIRGALLQEGVEARSPLVDRRVVEFALSRPVSERSCGAETKILLRASMKGLLPRQFLAPRPFRSGTTVGYSRRRMHESYPELLEQLFSEPLRVAELGIIDPAQLRHAAETWTTDNWVRVNLFSTMRVEFWLRGLDRRSAHADAFGDSAVAATLSA